jgi:cytochrome c oxidase subunit 1
MFVTVSNERLIPFMTTTELISIPTGLMYLAAIGTLWRGRLRLNTPMLLVLFSMLNFLLGGVSGVFLADVPADFYAQDTYFVVAHFHYTILGGMVFAWLAGLYYWFPKYTGRMYHEGWGKAASWLTLVAFNATFGVMFFLGLDGMNRRVASYLPYLQPLNLAASIAGFALGVGFLIHALNLVISWARGRRAEANPWRGKTLEWETSSPPPRENFEVEPLVLADFYGYGETGPEPEVVPLPGARPRRLEPLPPVRGGAGEPPGGGEHDG